MSGGTVSYTINIGANISKVKEAMKEVSLLLSSSNLDKGITSSYERKLGKLSNALLELENKASLPIKTDAELRDVERSIKKVTNLTSELGLSFKELLGKDLSKVFGDFTKPVLNLKDYIKEFDKLEKKYNEAESKRNSDRLAYLADRASKLREIELKKLERLAIIDKEPSRKKRLDDLISKLNAEKKALENTRDSLNRDIVSPRGTINKFSKNDLLKNLVEADLALLKFKNDYKDLLNKNDILTKSKIKKEDRLNYDFEALRNLYKLLLANRLAALENAKPVLNVTQGDDVEKELDKYKTAVEKYKEISELLNNTREQIAEKKKKASDLEKDKENNSTKAIDKEIADLEAAEGKLKKSLDNIDKSAKESKEKILKSFNELKSSFKDITKNDSFDKLEYNEDNFKKLYEAAKNFSSGLFAEAAKLLLSLGISFENLSDNAGDLKGKLGPVFNEMSRTKEMSDDFEHLTWRLKYFFSLAGGFNLMRRAIRSAVTTTKELDAVMTQTAVVSLYTVGDMWKTLPQYSKEAQKLGVAIKDVYSALTLYVQLGLDMNSAMDIGIETMKMARVANIGAEEATNSMTAALRGFNMELTETSAKRVNDVYSKLAQNTASNTQEISTAMTKTAALANSANMSFENTAAFLATIIESTREGAETAGTALKTVIARFTEVKKLYSQGELLGTDEEGQEVDVNKISKALRTAGINMNDFFTGAKGLDEIFMELGSKWDSLTTVQQRYIATMAAGSRQQSRFLALMQNYSRTVELTLMAYNSAGSGLEQFDKTLESLDAKVNKFKDAWATFVMSISNSDAIKGIVDVGTDILNFLNNIINKISGNNGLVKSILSIATAIGVFKGGRAIFRGLLGDIKSTISGTPKTSMAGRLTTFWGGAKSRWGNTREGMRGFPELFGLRYYSNYKQNAKEAAANLKNAQYNRDIAAKELEKVEKETPAERASRTGEGPSEKLVSARLGKAAIVETYNAKHSADVEEKKEELKKEEDKVKSAEKENTEATENAVVAMNNYAAAMQAVGVAAGIFAGILGLVANKLEETGHSDAAKVISGIAAGLGTLAVAAQLAGAAFTIMGNLITAEAMSASAAITAIPIIGWIAGLASAAVAIGTIIAKSTETTEEKLERLKLELQDLKAYLESVENEYDEINNTLISLSEQEEALKGMTARTEEWDEAVKKLNNDYLAFGEKFPDYLEAIEFDEKSGRLILNPETVERINKKREEEKALALVGVDVAEIAEARQEYLVKKGKLKYTKTEKVLEEEVIPKLENGELLKYSLGAIKNIISLYSKETIPESAREEAKTIIEAFKSIIPNDVYNVAFDTDDYMYNALDYILDIYSLVEAYKEYLSVTLLIIRRGANSYVAGTKATGLVKTVAQEKGEEAANKKLKDSELEINIDDYVDRWAKSKGYTLVDKNIYLDKEGTRYDITDSTVKESIRNFAKGLLASQASQEAIDSYLRNISVGNYKLVSGLGTYEDYVAALRKGGLNQELIDLYATYRDKTSNALGDLGSLTQEAWTFNNLSYLEAEDIKTLGKNWLSKFGKSAAKELLLGFLNKLNNLVPKEEIGATIEALVTVLGNVESGAITNLQEFSDALAAYGIKLEDLGIDTSFLFKKPKTFEQVQEDLKTNLEFWNTARTSTSFDKEGRNRLIQGGMKEEDFILTSQGYISTKSTDVTGAAAKKTMVSGVLNKISDLNNLITALDTFNRNVKSRARRSVGDDTTALDILSSKDLSKENKSDVKNALLLLAGQRIYNLNTGEIININDISEEDAATFLQWYLDNAGRVTEFREEKGSLELELKEIKNSKLLGLAPEIQSAIIDIITLAILNGIDIGDADIDLLKNARDWFGSEKLYTDFLTSFSQLDWSEIDNINDFSEALKKLGIEFNTDAGYAGDLFKKLKEIYSFDISNIQKENAALSRIESVRETAEKIVSGEKTISESEFNAFKKILGEEYNPEEWVKTGKEYTYIGKADNLLKYVDSAIESYISSFSSPENRLSAYFLGDALYLLKEATSGLIEASLALEAQVVLKDLSFKVEDYGRKLGLDIDEINEEKDALNALAIVADKTEKSIDGLNEALSKDFQTLKLAENGTSAYNTAMSNILKAAKKVFGNDITSDWIEEHIEEFEDLAKGGDKALQTFEKLSKVKADDILKQILQEGILTGEVLSAVLAHWDELNGSLLEVGGTADFSNIFSGMELTEELASALAAYLNSIPDISAVWVPGNKYLLDSNGDWVQTGTLKITRTGASGSNAPTSGGGGGGGKKFKNDFDKYYNQVEDINELERQRNLLEKDYNQLLKSESKSGVEIYNNLKQQLELLEKRRELTADLAEKRKLQLFDVMTDKEYKDVLKYAKWNEEDLTIEIDWEAINKIKKSKEGDLVKEYVKKLEEYLKMYDEQIEKLEDIDDNIIEIKDRGREEYQNLEDRTRDALIKLIQDKIDELTDVNESINDTNQKLFDAINETLELQRQDRENKKTEEELTDKEKRLAYLLLDSSNANLVEIAKLQEELEDERQDYTDNLIDQKISELQRQNDKAQEQRQEQIDLMQHSLDWQEKSGAFWNLAYALLDEGIGPNGTLVKGSLLETLLKKGEAWDSLSQEGQMKWLLELEDLVSQGIAYLGLSRLLEDIGVKKGTEISFTAAGKKLTGEYNESAGIYDFGDGIVGKKDNNGNIVVTNSEGEVVGYAKIGKDGKATFLTAGLVLTGIVDKDGNVIVTGPDGKTTVTYKGVFLDYDGTYRTLEQFKDFIPEETKTTGGNNNSRRSSSKDNDDGLKDEDEYLFGKVIEPEEKSTRIAYKPGLQYLASLLKLTLYTDTGGTGGPLADPYLVLNSRDTENFIELKDTLTSLKSTGGFNLSGGDNYYDIKVQVESLSSDYDVDKAIDRIKARIAQDNAYRNVNTLSRLR